MSAFSVGPTNLITDIDGLRVGNACDRGIKTGVTALLCDEPAPASVHVMGGAPGTRETDLLAPENTVQTIDALVLSGGSAFGLDAASGVMDVLSAGGRGFAVGDHTIPIVPAAIAFDLINGGDKNWPENPYRALGTQAAQNADTAFMLGSHGAGTGALTADLKGGLGSASAYLDDYQVTLGALVVVNALGTATMGGSRHFWAAPFEMDEEFGGHGIPAQLPASTTNLRIKMRASGRAQNNHNTTIAIIATDAALTKAECKRLAIAAHDGFTRALWPAHTPLDGDLVFAVATGRKPRSDSLDFAIDLSAVAAATMARAIARGIYAATAETGDILPVWSTRR